MKLSQKLIHRRQEEKSSVGKIVVAYLQCYGREVIRSDPDHLPDPDSLINIRFLATRSKNFFIHMCVKLGSGYEDPDQNVVYCIPSALPQIVTSFVQMNSSIFIINKGQVENSSLLPRSTSERSVLGLLVFLHLNHKLWSDLF